MKAYLLLILSLNTLICFGQSISKQKISRQPYFKYQFADKSNKDTTDYYLSEFNGNTILPLIIYIQGSGSTSLFHKDTADKILPDFGHISWAYEAMGKVKLLIVEKPGVHFLDQNQDNPNFDINFSLDSWSARIIKIIRNVIETEKIDTSKIMVVGHSEGGIVAAKVAKELGKKISHVTIMAGEGPSQLYSLYNLAISGEFFNATGKSIEQRIDSLTKTWELIQKAPLSTDKKFWEFSYLRWSSFLKTSVIDLLSNYDGKTLIIQGEADKNVFPESARVLYTSLLSKGKNVSLKMIPNAEHSFRILNDPDINGWQMVIKDSIKWFLTN